MTTPTIDPQSLPKVSERDHASRHGKSVEYATRQLAAACCTARSIIGKLENWQSTFAFNIIVTDTNPDEGRPDRDYLIPKGENIAGGLIRARKIQSGEEYKLYD
jgi:hypothetical protein